MTSQLFPHLFSPLRIGNVTLANRIVSSGHDTVLVQQGKVTDELVAYHEARAAGGVGMIVVQVAGVHETARYTSHALMATDDDCIPGYRRIADVCHRHECVVVGQIFHPGREILESQDGSTPVSLAPSAVPSERFHVMPRAMTAGEIDAVVRGTATLHGDCSAPDSTASRSSRATAIYRHSSSTPAPTSARTSTAGRRRIASDSSAPHSRPSVRRSAATSWSG